MDEKNSFYGSTVLDANYGEIATGEVKQPQVQMSLEALEGIIDQQLKQVAEMEHCLAPVLRSEPQPTSGGMKDSTTVVPLAERVNVCVARLHTVLDSYRSILRRLEL